MADSRPPTRPPRAGSPVRNVAQTLLDEMAKRAVYVGSRKHKRGSYAGEVGTPGPRPTTVEQARVSPPTPPYTMLCPLKWNQRAESNEATTLLQSAITRGQIGHPIEDGLPEYVWARDPEDPSIVYAARRLTSPSCGYKAYPLLESQVALLGIQVR